MKKYLLLATALAALASCTSDDFVGDGPNPTTQEGKGAIVFNTGVNTVTRAELTGSDAATKLNNNFVFAGTKGDGTPTTFVFDQYTAQYANSTANTTESNSNDWEYVGYMPASTSSLKDEDTENQGTYIYTPQTIKYWDYSTTQYDFAAYSLGNGVTTTTGQGSTTSYATASAIAVGNKSYTLTGSADELKACYISDLVTAYNRDGVSDYGQPVKFSFRSLAAKIRLAFYETVPGYSVKNVQFYTVETGGSASTTPALFTSDAVLPAGSGTMTITFPHTGWDNRNETDYNKAHVAFTLADEATAASTVTFGALTDFANAEKRETADDDPATGWIGRASNAATYAGGLENNAGKYYTILPYETGANLLLRIKYTLVSTDGTGEIINVDNASAVVPAELAQWNPNYAYTYIFKIGDMTNGSTGVDGNGNIITGLTPITLNAVVVDSEDGVQETITTVSTPSITTYTKGKVVTVNDEYVTGAPIYIIVNDGTSNVALTGKANLYTVTLTAGTGAGANPSQSISEASVDNALTNGTKDDDTTPTTWTVSDANNWDLVVTKSDLMSLVNVIDAADSPTGNEISIGTGKVGKFTPTTAGTYVFQYQVEAAVATGTTYTAAEAAAYNAALPGAIPTEDGEYYSFTSYASDQTTEHGTGIVKVVSKDTEGEWTTVVVVANNAIDVTAPSFVGQVFWVKATSLGAGPYELYSTNNDSAGLGISVTVEESSPAAYNATLPGAVSTNDTKPATPAKYQYKIIKIAQ